MSRNLKAFGSALIVVVAIGAISVSAAQATNVTTTSGKYPARLTVQNRATKHGELLRLTIGAGARFVECKTSTLSATITGPTTKLTVTPPATGEPFHECFSNGLTAVPATVTMNKCDLTVEATSKTTAAGAVDCEKEGEKIEVHVYENATTHMNSETWKTGIAGFKDESICTFDIGPQTPTSKTTLEGTAEDIHGVANFEKIVTENTVGSAGLCGIAAGAKGNSSLTGKFTATGEKDEEKVVATGIMLE